MINIKVRNYYTADLLQQYNKSYIPPINLNILKFDNDELTYYVIKDTTVTKHLSQLTFKHLLV